MVDDKKKDDKGKAKDDDEIVDFDDHIITEGADDKDTRKK